MLAVALALAASPVAAIEARPRLLVVTAPAPDDRSLIVQRRAIAGWRQGAAERDLRVVEVVGDRVTGAQEDARTLRRRYHLPASRFAVVLVGKDRSVAMRAATPLPAARLEATIDAMPMRRAGQR